MSKIPSYTFRGQSAKLESKPDSIGNAYAVPAKVYSGTEMIGVAVLHKSCLQPVFSKESAEDIAKMRR